jgi:hypothetical protein
MEQANDLVVVSLTREEAVELFTQCLRSCDDDTEISLEILRKLGRALKFDMRVELAA